MLIISKSESFSDQTSHIYCCGEVSQYPILNFFFNGSFYQIEPILDEYGFGPVEGFILQALEDIVFSL